jgi:hypothetical protein
MTYSAAPTPAATPRAAGRSAAIRRGRPRTRQEPDDLVVEPLDPRSRGARSGARWRRGLRPAAWSAAGVPPGAKAPQVDLAQNRPIGLCGLDVQHVDAVQPQPLELCIGRARLCGLEHHLAPTEARRIAAGALQDSLGPPEAHDHGARRVPVEVAQSGIEPLICRAHGRLPRPPRGRRRSRADRPPAT